MPFTLGIGLLILLLACGWSARALFCHYCGRK